MTGGEERSTHQAVRLGHEQDAHDNEYATPPEIWRPLARAVDGFDTDPASGAEPEPIAPTRYTAEDDGLRQSWDGWVWLNPPWSSNGDGSAKKKWARKARNEAQRDAVDGVVMLLPCDTSSHVFHDHVAAASVFCLVGPGRISFRGEDRNPSFELVLAVYADDVPADLVHALDALGIVVKGRAVVDEHPQSKLVTDGGEDVGRASKHCLDLFAGLGGFSAAFRDAEDWTVTTVEIAERFDPDIRADVLNLRPSDLLDVVDDADHLVVLAGHPCTYLTYIRRVTTGGDDAWEDGDPATPECRDHVAMVHHTVGLIEGLAPDYWFLENPRGHMREVLGPPEASVWYCQYGHDNAKPTDLWGDHPATFTPQKCAYGNDDCDHVKTDSYKEHGGGSDNRQGLLTEGDSAERAEVPYELSKAIRDAVDDALAAEVVDRQAELSEVTARVE